MDLLRDECWQDAGKLVERGNDVRVPVVLITCHQASAEEQRDRLLQRELEGREKRGALGAEASPVLPDRNAHFLFERPQVAIHGAGGHADPIGDLLCGQPVRMLIQQMRDAEQAGSPVAFSEFPVSHACNSAA